MTSSGDVAVFPARRCAAESGHVATHRLGASVRPEGREGHGAYIEAASPAWERVDGMAHLRAAAAVAVAVLVAAVAAAAAGGAQVGPASSFARPDRLDVDSAIHNETRFQEAVACVLGDEDYRLCDHHTVGIKYDGWRMLERGCSGECTPDELGVYRFLAHVSHNRPDQWKLILDKFDPDGKLQHNNAQQWKEHGIKV